MEKVILGKFRQFICSSCGYDTELMAVGQASKFQGMEMVLYSCSNCHSLGSAWQGGERPLMCAYCYHEEVDVLDPEISNIECPRCEMPGRVERPEGEWE
ncbi:MAG TPA: hypothetical protein ENI67_00285 [Gammaproteobacteria bacterium]|nr:hypothetical protein [Gammaproteobacteria bacterium]